MEADMTRTALLLLPGFERDAAQARAAFDLWWQGATTIALMPPERAAELPLPVDQCVPRLTLLLWLRLWRFDEIVVAGSGASRSLPCRASVALPLRIA
jgi:hypothetical protein